MNSSSVAAARKTQIISVAEETAHASRLAKNTSEQT